MYSLFGWNIVLLNLTTGALLGYSSENSSVSLKVPAKHVQMIYKRVEEFSCRLLSTLASIPWGVIRAKNDGIPHHDTIAFRRSINTLGRIILKSLEIPH